MATALVKLPNSAQTTYTWLPATITAQLETKPTGCQSSV